jgi:hypothetical protein
MAKSPEITLAQNFQNLVNKLKAISKHTSLSTKGLEKLAKMLVTSGNHTDRAVKQLMKLNKVDDKIAISTVKAAIAIDKKNKKLKEEQIRLKELEQVKKKAQERAQMEQLDILKHQQRTKKSLELKKQEEKEEKKRILRLEKLRIARKKHNDKIAIMIDRMKEAGLDTERFRRENEKLIKDSKKSALAMDRLTRASKNFNHQIKRGFFSVRNFRNASGSMLPKLSVLRSKLLLASFAVGTITATFGRAIKATVSSAATFETLQTRLNSLFGSAERGQEAFDKFNKIAATTPFTVQGVVEAGAKLKAFGVDAEDMIKPVADLAAFMGVDIVEAAGAMGRAFAGGAGAADVLRERGILQLIKDSQGIKDLTKITLPQFRDALVNALQDPHAGISGSTDALAKTYQGAMSNMQDSVFRAQAAIGKRFKEMAKTASISVGSIASSIEKFFLTDIEKKLVGALKADDKILIDFYKELLGQEQLEKHLEFQEKQIEKSFLNLPRKLRDEITAIDNDLFRTRVHGSVRGAGFIDFVPDLFTEQGDKFIANIDKIAQFEQQIFEQRQRLAKFPIVNQDQLQDLDELLAVTGSITGTTKRQAVVTQELNQKTKDLNAKNGESVETLNQLGTANNFVLDIYNSLPERQLELINMQIKYVETLKEEKMNLDVLNHLYKVRKQIEEGLNPEKNIERNKLLADSIKSITNELARMLIVGENITKLKPGNIIGQMLLSSVLQGGLGVLFGGTKLGQLAGLINPFTSATANATAGASVGMLETGVNVASSAVMTESLNRISQTGGQGGNIVVNVSAPLVDETVVDTIIPAINNAVRRGETLG